MVLLALKNCDLIGASWGASVLELRNEEHDGRAGCAFQPWGMDGRRIGGGCFSVPSVCVPTGTDLPSDQSFPHGDHGIIIGPTSSGAAWLAALYLKLFTAAVNQSKVLVWPAVTTSLTYPESDTSVKGRSQVLDLQSSWP